MTSYVDFSNHLYFYSDTHHLSTMSRRQTPNEFLQQIIGRPVVVKLNSGVDYRGMLHLVFVIIVTM